MKNNKEKPLLNNKKIHKWKIFFVVFFSFTVCVGILVGYSFLAYPSFTGNVVGVSAGVPFLQQEEISDKVNINHAALEELMILEGIGESKAKAIIEYREENGKFLNIEDIMQVNGIKERVFEKIKDQICV